MAAATSATSDGLTRRPTSVGQRRSGEVASTAIARTPATSGAVLLGADRDHDVDGGQRRRSDLVRLVGDDDQAQQVLLVARAPMLPASELAASSTTFQCGRPVGRASRAAARERLEPPRPIRGPTACSRITAFWRG